MNLIFWRCRDCGAATFRARRFGFHCLVEWERGPTGQWLLQTTAGDQAVVVDLGQLMPGGYTIHLCPKMLKRSQAQFKPVPMTRRKP